MSVQGWVLARQTQQKAKGVKSLKIWWECCIDVLGEGVGAGWGRRRAK